jgi:hypothetical protein
VTAVLKRPSHTIFHKKLVLSTDEAAGATHSDWWHIDAMLTDLALQPLLHSGRPRSSQARRHSILVARECAMRPSPYTQYSPINLYFCNYDLTPSSHTQTRLTSQSIPSFATTTYGYGSSHSRPSLLSAEAGLTNRNLTHLVRRVPSVPSHPLAVLRGLTPGSKVLTQAKLLLTRTPSPLRHMVSPIPVPRHLKVLH